jgi:spore germination protein
MEIYVVKPGDTIYSIAQNFGISVNRLIYDNGLPNPYNLVQGQALLITYPSQEHIVKEGDTLGSIAEMYDVPLMQLLRNNSFLVTRENIYPDETLVISYQTQGSIQTNGYAYDFISHETLYETLPYLTYLSIFNYRLGKEGSIIKYGEDAWLIQAAKDYGVAPLFMISSLSPQGKPDIALILDFLLNETLQETYNNKLIDIVKSSGYYGINILVSGINSTNQFLYIKGWTKLSEILKSNGLLFFLSINPNLKSMDGDIVYEKIDYETISKLVDGITLLPYAWATNPEKPGPVNSLSLLNSFIKTVVKSMPPEKIMIGIPLIGYDWKLSNDPIELRAVSLTINSCIILALNTGSIIQFDEVSQTPYFTYREMSRGRESVHIVWFMDVRSIYALNNIIIQNNIAGSGIWNIMIFYQPLWSLIITQFEVIKLLPDNL